MNLTKFKQKELNQKALETTKGGLRLITRDTYTAFQKVASLSSSGKHYCYSYHSGEYCIEW